jgi:hypothetical protein
MTDQTDPPVRVLRARWSLGYWLNIWLVGSLFGGVFLGTFFTCWSTANVRPPPCRPTLTRDAKHVDPEHFRTGGGMRWTRIALVTAGLAAAGAVFGTLVGTVVLLAWLASIGELGRELKNPGSFAELVLFFGGGLGAVMGPVAAWVLMRHVPLWLAVGGPTLGTLAAGGIGLLVTGNPIAAMLWGVGGFSATAVALRLRVPRQQRLTAG